MKLIDLNKISRLINNNTYFISGDLIFFKEFGQEGKISAPSVLVVPRRIYSH